MGDEKYPTSHTTVAEATKRPKSKSAFAINSAKIHSEICFISVL